LGDAAHSPNSTDASGEIHMVVDMSSSPELIEVGLAEEEDEPVPHESAEEHLEDL